MPDHDPRPRVLVLDDDPATLVLEQRALERGGYSVLAARTDEEAVERVVSGEVEVLVIDYRLSGRSSGVDVFRRIRELGQPAPAILVTSFADESKIIEALRAGIRDVVPKSGDYLEYLPQAVARILGQMDAERQLAHSDMLQSLVDRLRVETHTLETINGVGRQLVVEHDEGALVQRVIDACTSIVGAELGVFFETVPDGRAPQLVPSAVSGAQRDRVDALALTRVPRLQAAFVGDATVLCEDLSIDPERTHGGPAPARQHGIRSALAVPILSRSGQTLGALVFGHPDPVRFHDREARLAEGIAAQAAIALDNARLIEALRTNEDRLRMATDAARLGTWDFNPISGSLQWSDRSRELFGVSADAPLDYGVFMSAVHAQDRDATQRAVDRALDPAGSGHFEAEYRVIGIENERLRWIRAVGRAFFRDGRAERMLGTVQDVTPQRLANEERERLLESERAARAESERASHLKDEFLATPSHELRTPLNAVLGWAQLVRVRARTAEQVADGLERIERNARAQAQIIDDLLDMSRIVSGKMRLDVGIVDLPALVESAIDGMRPAAEAKGIVLDSSLAADGGPITGDPGRLQQVVWNLLSNAIKFTPRNGHVHVGLERLESHIELTVSDTGQGIKPEFLPFLFDRFRQADASTTRQHRGMGIGLSIVKSIVEMHGGTAAARSDGESRGATFIVRLPLSLGRRDMGVDLRAPASSQRGLDVEAPSLARTRVLVVDDEPDARELIARILRECEAEVVAVASADEALSAFEAATPDVLVSDIGLPGLDGYSLIRTIRQRARGAGGAVPALALTAFARPEDRRRALMAGYQAHLSKPAEASDLVTIVASLAGRIAVTRDGGSA
jgi:signal transduction histidine kinase